MRINWSSEHCWIDKHYTELFSSASLIQYTDFVRNELGESIRVEEEKSISSFQINQSGKRYGFYIKVEFPKWYKVIKKILSRRHSHALASSHELQLLKFYKKNNISVVVPVAWGERRVCGIPLAGFLVQEEVQGQEFTQLVKNGSKEERLKLIKAYGKLLAELHSKGILSSAVRVTDLICTSEINVPWHEISLVVIDREKGKLVREKFTFDQCAYSLSFLLKRFYVFIGEPTLKEVCCFLNVYLANLDVTPKPVFKKLFRSVRCHY